MSTHRIQIQVNGQQVQAEVPARRMLSDFLRDDLHLTGTKRGCETGTCGACSVRVEGQLVKSCLSLAVQADGCHIQTVEGLTQGDQLHPLQTSFMNCGGLQCGYCTPGFLMAASALLEEHAKPSEAQIREALSGNLCRCTGYTQIVEAVQDAARNMHGH